MGEFILWLLVTLILTGGVTICGYKTKEAWDGWRHTTTAVQVKNNQDSSLVMKTSSVDVAKLRIGRAFEDFNKKIADITIGFPKESEAVANQFNVRGTIASGLHIKAQMELSINTKRKLDEEIDGLKRKIEDILIEILNKTSLDSAGSEFEPERNRFEKAKEQCVAIYPLLNDSPRSWEQKSLNEVRLTKDFDVLKGQKY